MPDDLGATRRSYDAVAADYAAAIAAELIGKPLDRALLSVSVELAAGGPLADIGCGPGHVTNFLSRAGARAFGLDLSRQMCVIGENSSALPFGVADLQALPLRTASIAGIVSLYAVIHLTPEQREVAYREFARVLRPGASALIGFHTGDDAAVAGSSRPFTSWFGHEVDLTFHFLDPVVEIRTLRDAGLDLSARTDREPNRDVEHPSRRTYLLVRKA